jgi:energy-coupling factor transport system permease protein
MCSNAVSYALMLIVLILCVSASRIKPRLLLRGLKPLIIIIAITAFLNIFYTRDGTVVLQIWRFTITREGIYNAAAMLLRISMLVSGTFLMTYTTSAIALTDGLEAIMNPLKKIKIPVHELSMMMSIALRFIPTLIEETDKIMSAQKARGANFESGNILKRAKAMLPLLIPLFISAFRRADELAVAMESRCYNGGEGRTKMKQLRYESTDIVAYALGVLVLAATVALRFVEIPL